MDASTQQVMAAISGGLASQEGRLGSEHPKVCEARALLAELMAIAESSPDAGTFWDRSMSAFEKTTNAIEALNAEQPVAGAAPTVDTQLRGAAAAYHSTRQASAAEDPTSLAIRALCDEAIGFEQASSSVIEFHRRLAEAAIPARLFALQQRQVGEHALGALGALSQPCMTYHYQTLSETLGTTTTITEIEYEMNRLVEFNAAENEWDTMLTHYASKAIAEVTALFVDRSEPQRETIRSAYRFVCDFFGKDWEGMWAVPRVWEHFCMQYEQTRHKWEHELDCKTPAQAVVVLTSMLEAVLDRREVPVGQPCRQTLCLWGGPAPLDTLLEVYRKPMRPVA